jgi:enoyl-CoA hydratase
LIIHREDRGAVAILRMDDGTGNLFDIDLVDALQKSIDEVVESDARALVITGYNSTFIDGGNLPAIVEGGPPYIKVFQSKFAELIEKVFALALPVIAGVNGSAIVSGYVLAAACDLRVMTTDSNASIGLQALHFGVPLEVVPMEMILHTISTHSVQDLMYTGRLVNSAEALKIGLVDELASPDRVLTRAVELATQLSNIPNKAFALTKRQIRQPTLERIQQYQAAGWADQILEIWTSSETLAGFRAILQQFAEQSANR